MGLVEFLRRVTLLGGGGYFLWLWFANVPALLEVQPADFARDYQSLYGQPAGPAVGVSEEGHALLAEAANPGSLEAFIAQKTEHCRLPLGDSQWSEFYRSIPATASYYAIDQPPFAAILSEIKAQISRSGRSVIYLPVRDGHRTAYIEIYYRDHPKESKARSGLVYPQRRRAWPFLAGALLVYAVLPWRGRASHSVAYSRAASLTLDVLGSVFAAIFFALSLYATDSPDAALGSDFGVTLFLWILGMAGVLLVFRAARIASFRVTALPHGLQLQHLTGRRELLFTELSGAGYLVRSGIHTGIFLRCLDGGIVKLDWAGLLGFEVILQALATAGIPGLEEMAA